MVSFCSHGAMVSWIVDEGGLSTLATDVSRCGRTLPRGESAGEEVDYWSHHRLRGWRSLRDFSVAFRVSYKLCALLLDAPGGRSGQQRTAEFVAGGRGVGLARGGRRRLVEGVAVGHRSGRCLGGRESLHVTLLDIIGVGQVHSLRLPVAAIGSA